MKIQTLILFLALTFASSIVMADQRTDLFERLADLRKKGAAQVLPDEMGNLEATVARAEAYSGNNMADYADRYYRMAMQQAILISRRLTELPAKQPFVNSSTQTIITDTANDASTAIQSLQSSSKSTPQEVTPDTKTTGHDPERSDPSILVGKKGVYTVEKGDTLRLIAARLGVNRFSLAAANGLKQSDILHPGQKLRYNNQRIIPTASIKDGLVINIPERMLYLYKKGAVTFSTAVALGVPTKNEMFDWQTPTGRFRITNKAKDPTWTVPPSIQEEMRLEGKEVITSIPPGKDNPLGRYAIKTSLPGILIHSTTRPWSIYTFASHGCIRVFPQYMEELFGKIELNSRGEIIYRPVKIAVTDDGSVLLEVHGDIYKRTKGLASEAQTAIKARKLEEKVDWEKVRKAVAARAGVAVDVTVKRGDRPDMTAAAKDQSPL